MSKLSPSSEGCFLCLRSVPGYEGWCAGAKGAAGGSLWGVLALWHWVRQVRFWSLFHSPRKWEWLCPCRRIVEKRKANYVYGSVLSGLLWRKTPSFLLSKCPAFKNAGLKQEKQYNNFRDTTENRGALPERGRRMACTYFSQGEEFPSGINPPKCAFHI